jgi:uncharacterized protein YbaP (TraB family)
VRCCVANRLQCSHCGALGALHRTPKRPIYFLTRPYLREALADLSNDASLTKARAVIDAWTSGDAAALDALIQDATSGGTVMSDFTRRTLLGKRNPEMAERIEHMLKDGKVSFVGVGLLHLLGANGLPQLLSQRGYQVERMY